MAKRCHQTAIFLIFLVFLSTHYAKQLQSSQVETLLRIQQLINFPPTLSDWNSSKTDFCNSEPSSSFTVVCYEENITQLHIISEKKIPLPHNFSLDSFVTTLVKLPNLKVLTLISLGLWGHLPGKIARLSSLEILNMSSNFLSGPIPQELSSLTSLQTLILDDNKFCGPLPEQLSFLQLLAVLSLKNNSFVGSLPDTLSELDNLRVVTLSHNHFNGEVPDLSHLTNLQVLDLEDNAFGPQFPQLGNKLVTLILRKNRFRSGIPSQVSSYYQLRQLDISFNKFVGPFPPSLLALPSITFLNIAGNQLTGMLFDNLGCNANLKLVDLSSNLLTGSLPNCLMSKSKGRVVLYASNCLATRNQHQNPIQFCRNEALAVGILPEQKKKREASKAVITCSIIGGIFGGTALVGIISLLYRRVNSKKNLKRSPTRSAAEKSSTGYTSKLLSDARYVHQTMRMGALGLSAYRIFSLEELEEATNNFDTSAVMGEGSHGQMYKGQLKDGSFVAIKSLKTKRSYTTQNFVHHIELISKLRHPNLVCALGHCFECYLDDSTVSRIFLVFEFVPNGTLRSCISEGHSKRSLTWTHRIATAIGIAKGIQFLHTGIVPGVYSNNLKIKDVLLDYNLVPKISSYNLPLLDENMDMVGQGVSYGGAKDYHSCTRLRHEEKLDVYDFGVILLEIIKGRPINYKNQVDILRDQLQLAITSDDAARRRMIDPAINSTCLGQSLKTMMEICIRCLFKDPEDRPSTEDVLWNLQYAAQVQEAWQGESQSSDSSPISQIQAPNTTFT